MSASSRVTRLYGRRKKRPGCNNPKIARQVFTIFTLKMTGRKGNVVVFDMA